MKLPAPRRRPLGARPARALRAGARPWLAAALAALAALAACSQIPDRPTPAAAQAPHWGETPPGWMAAAPADTLNRGPWWQLFQDPVLDELAPRVVVTNQNIAAAAAAVEQSRALLQGQRAGLMPSLTGSAGAQRTANGAITQPGETLVSNDFKLGVAASWDPDLWGRLRAGVASQLAQTQASVADLANATLSAQASFVSDYLSARELDAEVGVVKDTVTAYQRALVITENQYRAAIAQQSDVLQARAQLASTQAALSALVLTRAQNLHAMAVLLGEPPAAFQLPDGRWNRERVPPVPVGLPSQLLQRRPDIAAAERAVASANAQVGVAHAAFFPDATLSASRTQNATHLGQLFNAAAGTWGLGLALTQPLWDFGALAAAEKASQAAWSQAVANYRQAVLNAFQEVEDQLATATSLEAQQGYQRTASEADDKVEQEIFNGYVQGINAYTDVITAQTAALAARRTLLQVTVQRQTAAVSLIAALGGGWSTAALADEGRR